MISIIDLGFAAAYLMLDDHRLRCRVLSRLRVFLTPYTPDRWKDVIDSRGLAALSHARHARARGIKIKNEIARNFHVIPIDEGRLSIGLHRSFTF